MEYLVQANWIWEQESQDVVKKACQAVARYRDLTDYRFKALRALEEHRFGDPWQTKGLQPRSESLWDDGMYSRPLIPITNSRRPTA